MEEKTKRKGVNRGFLSSRIKSAKVSLFPEAALGYLVGPCLALCCNAIVNIYLIQYWDTILGLRDWAPLFEVLLPLLSSIIIVVGNLVVGKMMEGKPRKSGKARPLLLAAMPLIAVAVILLFLAPMPSESVTVESATAGVSTMIMVAVGYILYYAFAYPFYYTSHSALPNLSTRDGSSRSLLATASNAAQLGAAGIAGMIGPFIVDLLGLLPEKTVKIDGKNITMDYVLSLGDKVESINAVDNTFTYTNSAYYQLRCDANSKWVIISIIMIVLLVLGVLLEFMFTRERITEEKFNLQKTAVDKTEEATEAKKVPISTQMKICVHDKYWWLIIIFYFFYQLGGMMKNNSGIYFSKAFTGGASISGLINIVGAIPTALGMLIIWPLARKYGKSRSIKVGALFAALFGFLGFVCLIPSVASNTGAVTGLAIAAFCLKACGTVPAMYISLALLGDVMDHEEALYGIRTDGFTMAVYGSIMIAMTGIANAIILGVHNVVPTIGSSLDQAITTTLYFGGESLCYVIILLLFLFMNVEKYSALDQKQILKRQKEQCLASGKEWIEPEERALMEEEENKAKILASELEDLEVKCSKKGLDFQTEKVQFLKQREEAEKEKAEKKAANDLKKAEKTKLKEEQRQAKLNSMSPEQRESLALKEQAKAEKRAEREREIALEYEELLAKAQQASFLK